ncbi:MULTISPECIES: hypothetical protein [Pseudovibrio]|uniref:hypothetical protein n=1 Tax=Stappiaceae TaxID=2821832 RepID=UPI0023650703|nr:MULTISPECIES: hypothetical protein [Pseudovibrio]MDD7911091.1 hypothetical protein [Pseudovibrio exalbescens]MDX5595704.1 hypothetical protein [Pseudovibrio sp. SPO723]
MEQVTSEYEYSQDDGFSEAELMLLKYQLEENDFAELIRLATKLPSEKWAEARTQLSALSAN